MLESSIRTVHFIGIGGSGMSAIAWVLLKRGYVVTGSDLGSNNQTARLAEAGATIYKGHSSENMGTPDLVVVSTAIPIHNPERLAAQERNIPVWQRARMLAAIMDGGKSTAIAGAHGKTTTTSMSGLLLKMAGLEPTVLVGGELNDFGGNAHVGRADLVVAEADESDGSFLLFHPDIAVVTNVEADHLDHWKNFESLKEGYAQFLRQCKPEGKIILCVDSPGAVEALERSGRAAVTYSITGQEADWQARDIQSKDGTTTFELVHERKSHGTFQLSVPGHHNVSNALAALAVANEHGVDPATCRSILPAFHGTRRRWDRVGEAWGVTIVDDYAHHPTEIAATLSAARNSHNGRVIAIFQPHRYTRTHLLCNEFGRAFESADLALILDVYSAGESAIEGVSGDLIADRVRRNGSPEVCFFPVTNEVIPYLMERLQPDDLVLTMGAGDVWKLGQPLLDSLKDRSAAAI